MLLRRRGASPEGHPVVSEVSRRCFSVKLKAGVVWVTRCRGSLRLDFPFVERMPRIPRLVLPNLI